jgi:integrase
MIRGLDTVRRVFESLRLGDSIADSTSALRRFELQRWERLTSDPEIGGISLETLKTFQCRARRSGLAPETVETTINTVMHVLNAAHEEGRLERVPRRPPRRKGDPSKTARISLSDFDAFLAAIPAAGLSKRRGPEWWQAFWGTIFFTALRLGNMEKIERRQVASEVIEVRQLKTGHIVRIPVHPVLRRLLRSHAQKVRGRRLFRLGRKTLYSATVKICKAAGVQGITPQAVRALAARTFERAHPGAGRLILGRPLPGADAFYFDVPEILESACDKLRVPPSLLTSDEQARAGNDERQLLVSFRGLGNSDRETVLRFVQSLRRTS